MHLTTCLSLSAVVPLVTPTNSPRIGSRSAAHVSIPESAANGYISFSQSSVTTHEPDSGFGSTLAIDLTRSGAYGRATVTWTIVSITTNSTSDLGTSSGVIEIANGTYTFCRFLDMCSIAVVFM